MAPRKLDDDEDVVEAHQQQAMLALYAGVAKRLGQRDVAARKEKEGLEMARLHRRIAALEQALLRR